MSRCSKRSVLALLAFGTLGLVACHNNSTAVQMRDLTALSIPGLQALRFDDESSIPLSHATGDIRLEMLARGASDVDALQMATDGQISDEAIARHVDLTLGAGWHRSAGTFSAVAQVNPMVWETEGKPKRFFALAAFQQVLTAPQGAYRPMIMVFSPVKLW